ncbi:ESX secretion-associated protein EspG [Nocardia abscessus]|uniref:ESX secretion-associated protein EspG n=1 Tax=Nocardia abscessus TaxID=120957 RepID=UPI0002E6ED5D|nr:ESX secretion-associated protein EspG [Nocardia abscessus]MCC3333401.1 ESX secretion-associated protein EspG [Nocardia abscessus]
MTTQTVWDFSPDEFAWVWATETGRDEYPDPISIIETPTNKDEYDSLTAEISARYPRHGNPDLTGPLRALADPELRIACIGRSLRSHKRVRTVAVAVGDLGVVLFQRSGMTADFGGDIKLVVTRRQSLGRHIAATMPAAPAGAAGRMIGYTPRVRGEEAPTSWRSSSDREHPVEERIRTLLRLPRTAEGHLRVERYLHDRRPHPPSYVSWIDIRDDHPAHGRYLISVENTETVVLPASSDVIAGELDRRADLGE